MMVTNLKLRGRLFVGFSTPVLLVIGFSGLVYSLGNQVAETFKEVNRAQEVIIKTDEMVLRVSMMDRYARGYLLRKGKDVLKEYEQQRQRYQKAVEDSENLITEPEQRKIFKEMVQLERQFQDLAKETFFLVDVGKQPEAVTKYINGAKEIVGKIDDLNEEFNTKQLEILAKYTENANELIKSLILAAVVVAILSLSIASVAAYYIWSTVTGTINQTVNVMAASSTEIAATVEQQERNATHQATSVNETTSTMNELGASSRNSSQQAQSALESARQVLSLAEDSAAGARQVLSLAEDSAAGARQVLTLAEGGTTTVERTLDGIFVLQDKVQEIAKQILMLSEQTDEIGTIANLVTDLANQTNMLAINAAVEAVRAGENGKGFGVVATEIRKLADQSKRSAEKISKLAIGIRSAIDSTVEVTQEGSKTAQEGIKLSRDTSEAFKSVAKAIDNIILTSSVGVAEAIKNIVLCNQQISIKAIDDVVVNNQQISLTAKQQAIAIEQVMEAMNNLNQGAIQTASSISQTKIGIQKLKEAAQKLQSIV